MPAIGKTEYATGVSRAIRDVQRVLLRNDLDPFEFVIDIRAAPVAEGGMTYVLMISTANGAASVRKSGIPRDCIENGRDGSGSTLPAIVQNLVPQLLDRMRSARKTIAGGSGGTLAVRGQTDRES